MSATIAITSAAISSGQAAVAAAAANRAKVVACEATMPSHEPKTVTVAQMQDYAACVRLVHPAEMSSGGVVAAKIFFIIALIGGAFACWYMRRYIEGPFTAVLAFGFGFILAPCLCAFIMGVLYGIYWLVAQ